MSKRPEETDSKLWLTEELNILMNKFRKVAEEKSLTMKECYNILNCVGIDPDVYEDMD